MTVMQANLIVTSTWMKCQSGYVKKPTYLKSFATYFEVSKKAIVLHKTYKACLYFILENFIDGLEFEDLSPEDVFKMISAVGIAKKIIRMLPGDKVNTSTTFQTIFFSA